MRTLPLLALLVLAGPLTAQGIDKQKLFDAQTFWDNKDWDWYKANIPFFDCPDPDLVTTYYYRWELLTKHLTYGSPNTGYVFTEFIDRPFWSGTYGAISCPAGLQLYEARWLQDPRVARDYLRYWFKTPGAEPRRYSTWLADAAWAVDQVHPGSADGLLPDLIKNYEGWEARHFVKGVGLFWQTGHDDGMEFNINSRQTTDPNRGAPAYRPTLNAYMYADALAIARFADRTGDKATADIYRNKATALKENLQKKLWDPKRQFFYPMAMRDEQRDKFLVKYASLTHQTGQFASNEFGRELIGYLPWQFNLPDAGYEAAWKKLMDKDGFLAPFGPTTVERKDPMFKISPTCCWWSGNSWPYATSQTLKAMANLLRNYKQDVVTKDDYLKLLTTYAKTHRKNGKPYIAEACHPDTGSWEGHDNYNHSEHYFHSNYVDLIITGLVGLQAADNHTVSIRPLAPGTWDYFAVVDVPCRGNRVSVMWDRAGNRYGLGKGLHVLVNGERSASSPSLEPVAGLRLPEARHNLAAAQGVNFAVNNDGLYFPRVLPRTAGRTRRPRRSLTATIGTTRRHPTAGRPRARPTRPTGWPSISGPSDRSSRSTCTSWTTEARSSRPPALIWSTGTAPAGSPPRCRSERQSNRPAGGPMSVAFRPVRAQKLRAVLTHRDGSKSGLTEFEAWGEAKLPVESAPLPAGNLAFNPGDKPFPKASASFTSKHDKVAEANDGKVIFHPSPHNRWTSYESPNGTDWLEIDFGDKKTFRRVELAIYEDRGGVQAPQRYVIEYWDGSTWKPVANDKRSPEKPTGGQFNETTFDPVTASKVRVVFTHRDKARSGVSEVFVWAE